MRFDVRDLATFQNDFLWAITTPTASYDPGLVIHRDTGFFGLLDGLCDIYEATRKALGDEAFKAFARDFIRAHPLTSGDRNAYGGGFAGMLQLHPHLPAAWLPDLAHFEWALHEAHHARDAEPCVFESLMAADAKVALHPSSHILSLSHDVRALHAAGVAGSEPAPVRAAHGDLLIGRTPEDEIVTLCLAPLEVDFLMLVSRHRSLLPALEQLDPDNDDMPALQNLLAGLVARGLLVNL